MEENTGLMLSETRGPLSNLIENLSGKHGKYWLTALKKMLRKEEIPEPSIGAQEMIDKLNSQESVRTKIDTWFSLLKKIPVVADVRKCFTDDQENGILDIDVYPCLADFFRGKKNSKYDRGFFVFNDDATVVQVGKPEGIACADQIYKDWAKESYNDLPTFMNALLELGEKYNQKIPISN